jgi:N-acetylmuramoyl-L-alanine amidase
MGRDQKNNKIGPGPDPEEEHQALHFYPSAKIFKGMKSAGKYIQKYPLGLVVHFTEGRQSQSLSDGMAGGINDGYAYMFIDAKGNVAQSLPFTDWGYHAGSSSFPGLGSGLNSKCVGVEVACSGLVEWRRGKWQPADFDLEIPKEEVFTGPAKENIQKGSYQKFTDAQFRALVELILWMKANNPNVFHLDYVVGHDEIAPGRKSDPGWSLGMTMSDFREHLKAEYAKRV